MVGETSQEPAFSRSPKNGFRCVLYPNPGKVPQAAFAPIAIVPKDYANQKPVSDSVFKAYEDQFSYDSRELNARVEWRNERAADWVQEKVTVDAAYGNEKLPIYLFLPKGRPGPYQAVIYLTGGGSTEQPSSKDLDQYSGFRGVAFIVKSGRAVVYPVYKGTFERRDDALTAIVDGAPTRQYSDLVTWVVKDLKTTVDYLTSRPDIDGTRIASLGLSYGGRLSPIILAVEGRLKAGIVEVGGFRANVRPEVDGVNYASRVKVPVLMLNGKYDMNYPFDATVKPMFDLLGTPKEHKRLVVYETDHFVPHNELMKETLAWLDRHLGSVK
jgi:eukaryotic-like serine/threonine-protein kinase